MPILTTVAGFDGANGYATKGGLVADAAGDLFGTTSEGGANGDGTVFEVIKTATGYASTPITLVNFDGTDGDYPYGGLIIDAAGDLFGTTQDGGASGVGTVFEIPNTDAGYASTPITLTSFAGTTGGSLIADADGDLFGATAQGGVDNFGSIFEIPWTAGGYASTPTTVASFDGGNGFNPSGSLIADPSGDLFGTAWGGGANDAGAVFEIARIADGYAGTPTLLASFDGADGATPLAGVVADAAGDLFGTTSQGGAYGDGTVFEIAKTAGGYASTPTTLVSFDVADGLDPVAGLLVDADGDLFGTTYLGGAGGEGTVFEIANTGGSYASTPTTLISFNSLTGGLPTAGLIADAAGGLFDTVGGGAGNDGSVFELSDTGFVVAPTISGGGAIQGTSDGATVAPFSGVTIADANPDQTETVTVTLSNPADGTLSNLAGGSYIVGTGVYADTGTAAAVSAALDGLVFTPTANQVAPGQTVTTTFTITDADTAGATAADGTATVVATDVAVPPTISGTVDGQAITDHATIAPFSEVTIADTNPGQTETVKVTLSATADGTLTNLGGGSYNAATGVYTDTGTAAAVSAALADLVFTPTANQVAPGQTVTTTFTITDSDTAGATATDGTTTVVATDVATPPTVVSVAASPDSGDVTTGALVLLTVTMSAAVTVSGGTPTLALNDGGTADYTGGSGSDALTFSYTVAAGQSTTALAVTGFNPNGATIEDAGGISANLSGALTATFGSPEVNITTSSTVSAAYTAILRTQPSADLVNQTVAQIAAGQTTLAQFESGLIASDQALYTTLPVLVTIDAYYGATPQSSLLTAVAADTGSPAQVGGFYSAPYLHSLGFSDPNVWTIMASQWGADPNSAFYATYSSYGSNYSSFIAAVYQREFGFAPSATNLQYLVNDVPGVENLLAGPAGAATPIQVVSGIYGYLLYVGQTTPSLTTQYGTAGDAFLQAAADGTVVYGPELTQEFPADPDVVTITGSDVLTDPGTGNYTIQFAAGASGDTLMLHTGGLDQVSGFNPGTDVLDFSAVLSEASVNLTGGIAALGNYVTIVDQGANALVNVDPTGHGGGGTVAVLQGLGSTVTALGTLIADNAIRTV